MLLKFREDAPAGGQRRQSRIHGMSHYIVPGAAGARRIDWRMVAAAAQHLFWIGSCNVIKVLPSIADTVADEGRSFPAQREKKNQ